MITFSQTTIELGGKVIVEDLNFAVGQGEFVCLIGASGCGKTTALRLAAGLYQPSGGTVTFEFRADRGGTFPFYSNMTGDARHAQARGQLVVRGR